MKHVNELKMPRNLITALNLMAAPDMCQSFHRQPVQGRGFFLSLLCLNIHFNRKL